MKNSYKLVAFLAACTLATNVDASVQVHPSSGNGRGALLPYATTFFNFDDLTAPSDSTSPLNTSSIAVNSSGSIGITSTPNAQVAQNSLPGVYAAPWLSGAENAINNGTNFGDPAGDQNVGAAGVGIADASEFLSTGKFGSVTLTLSSPSTYFGILWGSVDTYNDIKFFGTDGKLIKKFTGSEVYSPPTGNRDLVGTAYINFVSDVPIATVELVSNDTFAFEFDNVAVGNVPEATTIAVWSGLSLLGWAAYRRRS